ncbi:MAG: hypothetical protein JRI23_27460 [Deltaproteobacteria bacterium]|jgi:hypothetical protein|nr:hypothetical protein [Deltaproteobacteria bacterium]MBW2535818.1 hypothetical protein [Deltaproteobacteria bacterium]
MSMRLLCAGAAVLMAFGIFASCGDDDDGPPPDDGAGLNDQTGDTCAVPADCYPTLDHQEIQGDIECLDRVEDGYCTHQCTSDDDCCAVEGECAPDALEVCGPFESTGLNLCFLSCEDEDVGSGDPTEYCESFHPDFICRSTGGGSSNKKVCVPGGGQLCETADGCPGDWPHCCLDAAEEYRCTSANDAPNRVCLCAETADCPAELGNCCDDGNGGQRCYSAADAASRTCL